MRADSPVPTLRLRDTTTEPWRIVQWDEGAGVWRELAHEPRRETAPWVDAAGADNNVPWHETWWTLRCVEAGCIATKRWVHGPDGWPASAEGFNAGTWFEPVRWHVPSSVGAWAAFFAQLDEDASALLIRNVPVRRWATDSPWAPRPVCRRAIDTADERGWWAPHPRGRDVVIFDFDKLEPPAGWPGAERVPSVVEEQRFVRWVVRRSLPAPFWDAACAYRWSSSTGVPGHDRGPAGWARPNMHAAFILDRVVCDAALADWAHEGVTVRNVDASLFHPVQAHYLAAPVYVGAPSPWARPRWGVLDGAPKVATPDELVDGWTWQARAEEVARREAYERALARRTTLGEALRRGLDVNEHEREAARRELYRERVLDGIAADVESAARGGRHATARAKAKKLEGLVQGGAVSRGEAEAVLGRAFDNATGNERGRGAKEVRRLWKWAPKFAVAMTLDELRAKGGSKGGA